ncbi:hypothetical protein FRC09_012199 [Ceratobasidium sp. 395]|nr:hypothetical protein FRC09_012199 [Ceratobasidium sp. 395]
MQESNQQFEGPAEISYQSNSLGVIPENQTMGPEQQNIAYMYSVPPNDSADDLATWTVMHALQEHTQLSDAQTASIHASNSALPLYAQSHSEINAPYYHLPNVEPRQTAESSESPVLNRTQTPSSGYNYHRTTSRATLGAGAFYSDQQAQVAYKDVGVQTEPERSLSERGHVVKKAGRGEVTRAATTRNERSKRVIAVPTSLNRLPPAPRDGSQTRENLRLVQPTLYPRTGSGSRPPYPSSNHQGPSADITLEVPLSDSHHAPQSFGLTHHPAPQNGQDHQILTGLGRIPQSLPPVTRDHAPPRTAPQAPSIATPTPCNLLVHPLQQTQVPLSPYTPDDFIRQTLDGLTPAPRKSTSPVSNEQTPYLSCRHDSGTSHLAPGRSISIGHLPTPNPTPDGSLDKRLCYPPSPLGDMGTTQASIPGAPEASNQYHIESSATRQEGAQLQEGTYDHVVVPCILVNGASDTAPSLGGMSGQNRVQPGSSSERVQSRFQESSSSGTMHRPTQPLQSGVQGHLSLTNYRSTAQPQQQSRLQYNPSTQTVQSYAKSKQQSTSTVLQSNIPKAGQIYPERAERGEQYQTQALRFKRERSSCET